MDMPLISVVIVTWNRREDMLESVRSVYAQPYRNVEVVVVDNGSTDDTVEALRRAHPAARVIALENNTGASQGRNVGIRAARGDIIFTLDSDASLEQATLTNIVRKFQTDPSIGVIACKIINTYTQELDAWIFTEKDKRDQNLEFLSYSFCSAGSALRKEVLDKAGVFWDMLFIYCEEDDLSLRVWDAGYKILYYPEAIVYHRESPHKRVSHLKREYFDLRNSLYIYLVRYPWWMLIWLAPLQIAISMIKGTRRGGLGLMVSALGDVARQLPFLWQQRRPISQATARHYLRLQREHGPLSWDLVSWLRYKA